MDDWYHLRKLLDSNYDDQHDIESFLRNLNMMVQNSNETLRWRKNKILSKIFQTLLISGDDPVIIQAKPAYEKLALKTFVAGLSEPLEALIRCRNPKTIGTALEHIIEKENITYMRETKTTDKKYKSSTQLTYVPKNIVFFIKNKATILASVKVKEIIDHPKPITKPLSKL